MTLYDHLFSVEVSHKNVTSKSIWSITFLSHLKEWSETPLAILPDLNGDDTVSSLMVIETVPSNGIYPVKYTLWKTGVYEVSISSSNKSVSGSTYTIEVVNGAIDSSSSFIWDLESSVVAGEQSSFFLQTRDKPSPEVQALRLSSSEWPVTSSFYFPMENTTHQVSFDATENELKAAIESLPSIGHVSIIKEYVGLRVNDDGEVDNPVSSFFILW